MQTGTVSSSSTFQIFRSAIKLLAVVGLPSSLPARSFLLTLACPGRYIDRNLRGWKSNIVTYISLCFMFHFCVTSWGGGWGWGGVGVNKDILIEGGRQPTFMADSQEIVRVVYYQPAYKPLRKYETRAGFRSMPMPWGPYMHGRH